MTRHRTLRRALLPTLIASAFAGPRQADEYLLPQLNASGKKTHNHQYETQQTEIPSSRGTGSPFSSGLGDDTYHSAGLALEATQASVSHQSALDTTPPPFPFIACLTGHGLTGPEPCALLHAF